MKDGAWAGYFKPKAKRAAKIGASLPNGEYQRRIHATQLPSKASGKAARAPTLVCGIAPATILGAVDAGRHEGEGRRAPGQEKLGTPLEGERDETGQHQTGGMAT